MTPDSAVVDRPAQRGDLDLQADFAFCLGAFLVFLAALLSGLQVLLVEERLELLGEQVGAAFDD
ncbi:hypothetical protein ACVI1J_006638 [Bradyrhizobium diazoefficiens]